MITLPGIPQTKAKNMSFIRSILETFRRTGSAAKTADAHGTSVDAVNAELIEIARKLDFVHIDHLVDFDLMKYLSNESLRPSVDSDSDIRPMIYKLSLIHI